MTQLRRTDPHTFETRRLSSQARRQPPPAAYKLVVTPDGRQHWLPALTGPSATADLPVPSQIWIYLTDPTHGQRSGPSPNQTQRDIARRLTDLVARWSEQTILLYLVSFNAALTHGNVVDRLTSLAEKINHWQTVLISDGHDLTSTAMIDKLLQSPIDELCVSPAAPSGQTVNTRALNAVKDLIDLRHARRQNLPRIVCRLCADSECLTDLTRWSRQANVDRLDMIDGATEEQRLWDLLPKNSAEPASPMPNA